MTDLADLNAAVPSGADPKLFRTDYRRQRWYIDPLPACELAPATGDRWPALTTLKKAWNATFRKTWAEDGTTYDLDPLRVALYADDNWAELTPLPRAERVPRLTLAAKADLNVAADRGTAVHASLDLLLGGDERGAAEVCHPDYWSTVRRMVSTLGIELAHAERVAICRTFGWGGTFDGIVTIDGREWLIDWKTRGSDSKHGAYEAEAAQLGGYALADYIVVEGNDGNAQRAALPELAGGLVISIKPDSWEVYPVDLAAGGEACKELKSAWATIANGKSHARKAIGKPWSSPEAPADRVEWIIGRIAAIKADLPERVDALREKWDITGIAKQPPWTADEVEKLSTILHHVEDSWPTPDPEAPAPEPVEEPEPLPPAALWPAPDNGEKVDDADAAALRSAVGALEGDDLATMRAWTIDAKEQERPWSSGGDIHTRGFAIARAALRCIRAFPYGKGRDDKTRAAIAYVLVEDLQPAWRTGAVLGSLTAEQADQLADLADAYKAGDKTTRAVLDAVAAA